MWSISWGFLSKRTIFHLALQNNDEELRVKKAQEWTARFKHNFLPKDINCVGCCTKDGVQEIQPLQSKRRDVGFCGNGSVQISV
jgi:hypothetical protein